jgi:hypothetical protein
MGIGTPEVQNIVKASRDYGEPSEILQAISSFRSISALKEESSKLWAEKQELNKEASSMRLEVEDLQNKKKQIESSLKLYHELSTAGFDREVAATLTELCKNYGGVKHVIDAVSYYGKYIEIQLDVEDIEARKKDEETKLKEAEAKNKQFQTVIQLAKTLIHDLGYNVDAILQLHDMAKKYGSPEEAYNALSKYGDLKRIEEANENFRKTRIELQAKNREMYLQLQGLKGQVETVKEYVSGLLKPLATEITKTIDSTFQTLTSAYAKQVDIIKKESVECAKGLAKAELLGEELNLARTVSGLLRYPTEAKKVPFRYAFNLLDGVLNLCLARNLNPKITLRDAIKPGGTLITSDTEVDIFGLVEATKKALTAASEYA